MINTIDEDTLVPIGAIIAWAKNFTGVPDLPSNFAECDGSTISDSDSPMNGETLPDISDARFIYGGTSEGTTKMGTHNHTVTFDTTGYSSDASPADHADNENPYTTTTTTILPIYYEIVYIMRIK